MNDSVPAGLLPDFNNIRQFPAVAEMLELICHVTGMGFSAVARVTTDYWLACSVRDQINFGLTEGGQLKVETTICSWIRDHKAPVMFDDIGNEEHELYREVAALYGFTSYISFPIYSHGDKFFGTICAIDPKKLEVEQETVRILFDVFARWLSAYLQKTPVSNSFAAEIKAALDAAGNAGHVSGSERVAELIAALKGFI